MFIINDDFSFLSIFCKGFAQLINFMARGEKVYIISSASKVQKEVISMHFLKAKAGLMIFVLLGSFFSVYLLKEAQFVSAAPKACCERTTAGSFCVYTDAVNCDSNYHQTAATCEQTSYCQPVCCIVSSQGACYSHTGAAQCANQLGTTADAGDPSCAHNSQCQKGCCQLGNQCFLSTHQGCLQKAAPYPDLNSGTLWDGGISGESACIDQCAQQEEGCCVDPQAGCAWTTRGQCSAAGHSIGDGSVGFYAGTFCSDNNLACGCVEHFKKGCLPGKEEVYWFDSCGNQEGSAEDCDYQAGTLCKESNGEARCASVHCEQTINIPNNPQDPRIGGFRANGESWCTYESGTGGFYDRPGSRHYRHVCVNGNELVEECKDYREEICVQADAQNDGITFTTAQCKNLNQFPKVNLEIYQQTHDSEQSVVLPGTADFSDSNKKLVSITTVDKGSRFWEGENDQECDKGTTQCKIIWAKKGFWDDWSCEANCHCETQEYLGEAANYCKMFGDCGADINVLGKGTSDGLSVQWSGTGKGPHPKTLLPLTFDSWNVYGLYDGMKILKDIVNTDMSKTLINILSSLTTLTAGIDLVFIGLALATAYGASLGTSVTIQIIGQSAALGPYGLFVAAVIAVLAIIFGDEIGKILGDLLGYKTKEKTVTVECKPWTAPVGGSDCERCDDDVRYDKNTYGNPVVCSEYRCKSLGTACELVNVGTDNEKCVSKAPNDAAAPVISPWNEILHQGYAAQLTGSGYMIQPDLPYWQAFTFGVETDEAAQCKWDTMHTNSYQEMAHFFGTNLFETQANMTLSLPGGHDYTYYVRCIDVNGNANVNEYTIQFSTVDEPDLTAPVIEATSIPSGAYLSANVTSTLLWLKLNEPAAECWWNKGLDVDRNSVGINQTFLCGNNPENETLNFGDPSSWSFSCAGLLTSIDQGAGKQSTYHIRCTDLAGNSMQQGYQLVLKGSSPLQISHSEPSGTLYVNDAALNVITISGAENGKARCRYSAQPSGGFIDFFATGGAQHSQPLTDLLRGDYQYDVHCDDVAGNHAQALISFRIDADMTPPQILQIYASGDFVYVITDEPSTCSYDLDDPSFDFADGTLFGVDTTTHVISEMNSVYYVRCKDAFDNLLAGVSIYV